MSSFVGQVPQHEEVSLTPVLPRVALRTLHVAVVPTGSAAGVVTVAHRALIRCSLEEVRSLALGEGMAPLGNDPALVARFRNLTSLTLRGSSLTTFPSELASLSHLTRLDASHNKLTALPKLVSTALTSLSFEYNLLRRPLLELRGMRGLEELGLGNNPLEYLPDINHCPR